MGERGTPLWLEFRPDPLSGFGDQVSPHVHHERTTLENYELWARALCPVSSDDR